MHVQDQQQLNKLPIILKKYHPLPDVTKITVPELSTSHVICNGDNPPTTFRSYPYMNEEKNVVTSINVVSGSIATVTESVKPELDPPDPQELTAMNRMALEVKEETLDSKDEPETSAIQTQNIKSITSHDESFDTFSLQKSTTPVNEVEPELKVTRYLSHKYTQTILSPIIREVQHEKATKTIIIKIVIVFIIRFYNNLLNVYWFMIWAFDPGGVADV
jgi:hypothetical protein